MTSVPIKISKIGFCNFKFEDGQIPDGWEAPSDISNHYGIEFSFEYSWNGNHCYITNIQSEPIELDNTRTIKRNIELQSIEFKNDKCLTIDFNSTSIVNSESEFDTTIYGDEPKVYLGENENLEYEVTNSSYMLANFKYENRTLSGNEEDGFSTVIYYIDIPNIKIPKPSKYENNVVFTEEGVNELVGEVESKLSKSGGIMTGNITWGENALGTTKVTSLLGIDDNGNTSTIKPNNLTAGTASNFSGAITINLTGDVTGGARQSGLDDDNTFSIPANLVNSGVTAGSYGQSNNASPGHNGTFNIPYITVDAKGRITAASTKTITLPADNNTDTQVTQNNNTTDANYRILLSASANNNNETNTVNKNANLTYNPSTATLTTSNLTISGLTTLSGGKLILNTAIYGTAAPTAATGTTTGQIYFQLVN